MSLLTSVNNAVKTAISAINGLQVEVSFTAIEKTSFDPNTNTTTSGNTTYSNVKAFMVEYDLKATDGKKIIQGDMRAIIRQVDLTPIPKKDDTILWNGETWYVKRIGKDPTDAIWDLQIRR